MKSRRVLGAAAALLRATHAHAYRVKDTLVALFAKLGAPAVVLFASSSSALAAFGLTTTTDYHTIDAGSTPSLVFMVRRTDNGSSTQSKGDIMSLKCNGVELQDQTRGSHIASGFDSIYRDANDAGVTSVSVSAATVGAEYIKVTVVATDTTNGNALTHYYVVRKGYPHIYMATHVTAEPTVGELRWISRVAGFTNVPPASNTAGNTGAVESSDVFGMANGETRSKYYGNQRAKDMSVRGSTGSGIGMFMAYGNREKSSGGPFFRDIQNQSQEIYTYMNSGHQQTESNRMGLHGPYALLFSDGATPAAPDMSFMGTLGLTGWVAPAGRGAVTCSGITGRDVSYDYTVGFANATAQYWADASVTNGSFTCSGMLPGTYTMRVYKNELSVHTNAAVTVSAAGTTTLGPISITADPSTAVPLWRIGNWDGTPLEFLHGDKINHMHPSDVRITGTQGTAAWNPGTYVIGTSTPAADMPCYQWKDVNGNQPIQFNLTASQRVASTVRIGITAAYEGARPRIQVNSWTSSNPDPTNQPDSRSLTIGTYRGNHNTFTYSVPGSALVTGTNTLSIVPISGSGTTRYLSAGYSLDCIEIYQGSMTQLAVPGAPASLDAFGTRTNIRLNWSASAGAASYRIRRATTSGGPYVVIAAGVTGTTYNDTTALEFTTYYYRVDGANTSGTGLGSPVDSASFFTDTDADLIPDTWEIGWYPSPTAADPLDDTDGDGYNTWLEWKAGTNPTSSASKPGPGSGTATLTAVADTSLFHRDGSYTYNSTNYGTAATLDAGQFGAGIWSLSYLRFNLSTIPAGATITSAQFKIFQTAPSNIAGFPISSNDTWTTGRFGTWGLLDVSGNTSQTWGETTLTGDSLGSELAQGANPQFDTAVPRAVNLNSDTEALSSGMITVTGGGLANFLQGRLNATTNTDLATLVVDYMDDATSGARGFTFASRESTTASQRPSLVVNHTFTIPIPNADQDNDGLADAWEATHFSTLAVLGTADTDGDGTPEWLEQALGLDPQNPNQRFQSSLTSTGPNSRFLSWPNAAGVTFTVESSTSLAAPWNPEATIAGSGSPTVLSHPITINANRRFYRVRATR